MSPRGRISGELHGWGGDEGQVVLGGGGGGGWRGGRGSVDQGNKWVDLNEPFGAFSV